LHQDKNTVEDVAKNEKPNIDRSKIKMIDLRQVQINEKLAETGGSNAGVFSCYIDGWNCVMKELDLSGAEDAIQRFDTEIRLLEQLPRHPNITRYLHHERKGDKLRLYMTRYACSLSDYISKYREQYEMDRQEHFTPVQILNFSKQITTGISFFCIKIISSIVI